MSKRFQVRGTTDEDGEDNFFVVDSETGETPWHLTATVAGISHLYLYVALYRKLPDYGWLEHLSVERLDDGRRKMGGADLVASASISLRGLQHTRRSHGRHRHLRNDAWAVRRIHAMAGVDQQAKQEKTMNRREALKAIAMLPPVGHVRKTELLPLEFVEAPLPPHLKGRIDVYLDGVKVEHCKRANATEGWADYYLTTPSGRRDYLPTPDGTIREHGYVEIRIKEREPCP